MPKGAPGQPRTKGAGRHEIRPGTVYERSTIRISREAMAWLKRDANISQTIEKLAREKMNETEIELKSYLKYNDELMAFIDASWFGGKGLAPVSKPDEYHAIPETRPGRLVKTNLGFGVEVETHNCDCNFWYPCGVLLDTGIYYTYR